MLVEAIVKHVDESVAEAEKKISEIVFQLSGRLEEYGLKGLAQFTLEIGVRSKNRPAENDHVVKKSGSFGF